MRAATLAAVCAAGLLSSCRLAGPAPRTAPVEGLPNEEPVVRIGIAVDTAEVAVGATGPYRITSTGGEVLAEADAGVEWRFGADAAGRLVGRADGRTIGPVEGPVTVRARDADRPVRIAGRPYRGGVLLRAAGPGRVTAVNVLEMEAYLLGVVPLEIGVRPAAEVEAVKAQAVAARTYAVGHLGRRGARGFDFYATVADQVYGGVSREDPTVSRAVRETRGEILTHAGRPILAYYHSTCGGRTAAVEEVWQRAPLPYLKSVSDRVEGSEDRYYCESSNRFRWTERWTGAQLREILADAFGRSELRRVEAVEVTGLTPSGRAEALRIRADGRTIEVPGDSIRWVLRPEPGRALNSTLFVLDAEREEGEVRALRARGGGWGHGIGMCQFGAIGRARAGQSYREILSTYYRDTDLVRLY